MVLGTLWSHVLEQKADASSIPHCFLSARPLMAMPVEILVLSWSRLRRREKGQQCNWQSPGDVSRPAPAPAQAAESGAPHPLLPEPSSLPPSLALLWTSPQPSLPVYRTPCTHTHTHAHTRTHTDVDLASTPSQSVIPLQSLSSFAGWLGLGLDLLYSLSCGLSQRISGGKSLTMRPSCKERLFEVSSLP